MPYDSTTHTIAYDLSGLDQVTREAIEGGTATIQFGKSVQTLREFFSKFPDQMTALDSSVKVLKSNDLGYKTLILYLTPSNGSGVELCPLAELAKCKKACLYTAGKGALPATHYARLRKTLFFNQYQDQALAMINSEIAAAAAKEKKANGAWTLLVRLNGTSDIRWETLGIPQAFPNVQFYDYTKLHNRKNIPENYDLTYSYSGASNRYMSFLPLALANPNLKRVAGVFANRKVVEDMLAANARFAGLPVVDGDETDVRHIDPPNTFVALYAKGAARKDTTGFVIR